MQNGQISKIKIPFKAAVKYGWILHHLPFFLFMAMLALVYIANGHWADNTIRDINVTAKEVKNLEYEYKSLKSLEMFKSRESQVIQAAAPLGIAPAIEPPMRIVLKTTENKNSNNGKP